MRSAPSSARGFAKRNVWGGFEGPCLDGEAGDPAQKEATFRGECADRGGALRDAAPRMSSLLSRSELAYLLAGRNGRELHTGGQATELGSSKVERPEAV